MLTVSFLGLGIMGRMNRETQQSIRRMHAFISLLLTTVIIQVAVSSPWSFPFLPCYAGL